MLRSFLKHNHPLLPPCNARSSPTMPMYGAMGRSRHPAENATAYLPPPKGAIIFHSPLDPPSPFLLPRSLSISHRLESAPFSSSFSSIPPFYDSMRSTANSPLFFLSRTQLPIQTPSSDHISPPRFGNPFTILFSIYFQFRPLSKMRREKGRPLGHKNQR